MISSITWVPRGAANPNPPRFQACKEEVEAMLRKHVSGDNNDEEEGEEEEAEDVDVEEGKKMELDRHGLPAELRMDDYDDDDEAAGGGQKAAFIHADASESDEEEEEDEEEDVEEMLEGKMQEMEEAEGEDEDEDGEGEEEGEDKTGEEELAGVLPASAFMRGMEDDGDDDEDSEDMDDHMIRPTDAVALVANTEDEEHSSLEIHVYEEDTGSLYIHHDISLPAFPLCLAWGHCPPVAGREGERGSFVAVGTFKPGIEIWDVDVIDPLEPTQVLGGERALQGIPPSDSNSSSSSISKKQKGGKKKKKRQQEEEEGEDLVEGSHTGPVMAVAWNQFHRQVLVSGSADATIKLWDVTTGQCSSTYTHHVDKVASLDWHPVESTVLASAGFDKGIYVLDARGETHSSHVQMKGAGSKTDPECIGWCPHSPSTLLCATEDGTLMAWDVRSPSAPLWKLKAHAKTCSSFAFSPLASGLLATCGMDKTVKLWDYSSAADAAPRQLGEKAMSVGKLFTVSFYPSSPFLLATGGDKGLLALWDLHECEGVMRRFGGEGGGGGKEAGAEAASMMEGMTLGGEGEKEKGERKEKKMEGKKEKKKTGEKSRSCRKK